MYRVHGSPGCNVRSLIHLQLEAEGEKSDNIEWNNLEDYKCTSQVSHSVMISYPLHL